MNTSHLSAARGADLAAACSARSRSRPVIATLAPIAARPDAVARPIPDVPPVIRTVLPAIERSARVRHGVVRLTPP